MPIFALRKIESVGGTKPKFYQLVIDEVAQMDEYANKIQSTYEGELDTMIRYMEHMANGNHLPEAKCKDITPTKEQVKEYEFRSKHLRIYAIKTSDGNIVVFCGYKNNQPKDERAFRSLKKQYLESKKK